jgi:NhaP-type Na+/H+ and K+/H+ antiporter
VVALSMFITKAATIALMHTGMSKERAQFQARSAFSGAGFTTSESEVVVKHPVRRKIIMILILMGNAGVVTAISSLILGFVNPGTARDQMINVYLLVTGIGVLILITRWTWFDRYLDKMINVLIKRYTRINPNTFSRMMTLMDDFEITEVKISENPWLTGQILEELKLTDEGMLVLGVVKEGEKYNGVPRGGYHIEADDRLIIYGQSGHIQQLCRRKDRPEETKNQTQ